MSKPKKVLLALLVLFIAIQFIRPARNISFTVQNAEMITHFNVPAKVAERLKTSCYDCHSNNTRYPWYANVQPMGWFLASHVKDGKEQLNFNEFTTYSKRRQISKFKSIQNSIRDESMPLFSYTVLHNDAKFAKGDKASILQWTAKIIDSLSEPDQTNK